MIGGGRKQLGLLALAGVAIVALGASSSASAHSRPAVLTLKTVKVGAPGNPSVGIVPFTDAIYPSCSGVSDCMTVGGVDRPYGIGQLEITNEQWVAFLNTVDPNGANRHRLYHYTEASAGWPKYGSINKHTGGRGHHYSVAYPQWADKPYAFANFLRAARFVNSLYNGHVLSKQASSRGGFDYVTYKVRLSRETETGMYDMRHKRATRSNTTGFVIPSQDEWIKAAYYDPTGGGTDSYWKYPTNAGVFGDNTATAPSPTTLNPGTGDVTNAATQPLATYHDTTQGSSQPAPTWCPSQVQPQSDCSSVNPFGFPPQVYAEGFQGSVGTVGQAKTTSPWGTLDQGGNVVEWTDTITPPPNGQQSPRVWRRLHGGIANAPAYQLWLSAVGLNPQNNAFYNQTYPWLGFRIGAIGNIGVGIGAG